jgi:hypothetical protein
VSAVTPAELRQRVAARVAALTGWWEAPVPFEQFGPSAVPDAVPATRAHLAFSVGVLETVDAEEMRQRASVGTNVRTDVAVRFLARHTPGPANSQASQDAAFTAEHSLIKQMMAQGAAWPVDLRILYRSSKRTIAESGEWFEHTITFTITHLLALA